MRNSPVFAYCHIQKVGGTTLLSLLRQHFGLRHLDVMVRAGQVVLASQLRSDLRCMPFVRSVASHGLWPSRCYGDLDERLVWYVMLRDPVARYLSHFGHQSDRWRILRTFEQWLDIDMQKNWQTRVLAGGEQNLERAKQVLESRVRVVGLLERFNESLLMFREGLAWKGVSLAYGQPKNVARGSGSDRDRLRDMTDPYRDRIAENNALDSELYAFAQRLFERQVQSYGVTRLRSDCVSEFLPARPPRLAIAREVANNVVRRWIYYPWALLRGGARVSGSLRHGSVSDERIVVGE